MFGWVGGGGDADGEERYQRTGDLGLQSHLKDICRVWAELDSRGVALHPGAKPWTATCAIRSLR